MTTIINSTSQSPAGPESSEKIGGTVAARPLAAVPTTPAITTTAGESVTLSSDAVTTTQLLVAAQAADGMDQSAVQQLQGAVQAGTYDVSPEALVKAMASAFKEIAS